MSPWKRLGTRRVYVDEPWIEVHRDDIELPSGHRIPNFYRIRLPEHALALAWTPDGHLVTVDQFKPAVERRVTGFPAGYLEPDEAPLAAARRELLEETGYAARGWRKLGAFTIDGNRGCGAAHIFEAREARRIADPRVDPTETVDVRLRSLAALLSARARGRMPVAAHALALGLLTGPKADGKPLIPTHRPNINPKRGKQ